MDKIFYLKSGLSNEKAAPGISAMNFPKNKIEYKDEKRPWNMLASYRTLLSDLTSFFFSFSIQIWLATILQLVPFR